MGRLDKEDEHPRKKIKFNRPEDTESDPFGEFLDSLASSNNGSSSSSSSVPGKNAIKRRYHTRSAGLLSPSSTNSSPSSVLTQTLSPASNSSLFKKLNFEKTTSSKKEKPITEPSPTNLEGGRISHIKDLQSLIRVAMASVCFKKKCAGCGNHVQQCCGQTILEEISSIPHSP